MRQNFIIGMSKPSLARGTRDFGPSVMVKRNFILNEIRAVFQKFGFAPLETPSIENLSVLMGKYGDEGDQLLFKIINSGEFLHEKGKRIVNEEDLDKGEKHVLKLIAEKGLRYDLTVPFARFVVMNRHDLPMPFKRYQIQPVWRADRPQKGRYREFYQCDADVVGTDSLLCEAEIVLMLQEVFQNLGIENYEIKINNRKILTGIAEVIGTQGREGELCVAIDKLDKIGKEKVEEELLQRGFTTENIEKLQPILFEVFDKSFAKHQTDSQTKEEYDELVKQGYFKDVPLELINDLYPHYNELLQINNTLSNLKRHLQTSTIGMKGIEEIEEIVKYLIGFDNEYTGYNLVIDPTLARGLSYYTGAIFEVKALGVQIGSISGGGRYDNLTGTFGMPGLSGVGISLGVDRIFDVMEELGLFLENQQITTKVLLVNFDETSQAACLPLLKTLRDASINAELFPEFAKMKKQFDYANKKQIPFVMIVGSNEIASQRYSLKNMQSGEQSDYSIEEIIAILNNDEK